MAMADSPATTEVSATILDTTMATDTILAMAMATTLAMATTTEEVASETVNVLPTSSAVIFGPATNAQDQTIMVDQTSLRDVHLGVQLFDIYLDIQLTLEK